MGPDLTHKRTAAEPPSLLPTYNSRGCPGGSASPKNGGPMNRWKVWLWLVLPLTACDYDPSGIDVDCNVDRDFSDFISVSGADGLRVIADAGDLRIEGRT